MFKSFNKINKSHKKFKDEEESTFEKICCLPSKQFFHAWKKHFLKKLYSSNYNNIIENKKLSKDWLNKKSESYFQKSNEEMQQNPVFLLTSMALKSSFGKIDNYKEYLKNKNKNKIKLNLNLEQDQCDGKSIIWKNNDQYISIRSIASLEEETTSHIDEELFDYLIQDNENVNEKKLDDNFKILHGLMYTIGQMFDNDSTIETFTQCFDAMNEKYGKYEKCKYKVVNNYHNDELEELRNRNLLHKDTKILNTRKSTLGQQKLQCQRSELKVRVNESELVNNSEYRFKQTKKQNKSQSEEFNQKQGSKCMWEQFKQMFVDHFHLNSSYDCNNEDIRKLGICGNYQRCENIEILEKSCVEKQLTLLMLLQIERIKEQEKDYCI